MKLTNACKFGLRLSTVLAVYHKGFEREVVFYLDEMENIQFARYISAFRARQHNSRIQRRTI